MRNKQQLILSVALTALGLAPIAAQAEATHVRGTVVSLDGTKLVVHSREGADVIITLADKFAVTGVVKASLADLKPGTFVGTASMPQADGTLKSLELVIFPEAMRGRGEGHRPWDLQPNSKMTNGNVDAAVKSVDGETLSLSYKGGEQKITITEATPIVTFGAATVADITPGAVVFVPADKMPDGSIEAKAVVVGKDGVVPPM